MPEQQLWSYIQSRLKKNTSSGQMLCTVLKSVCLDRQNINGKTVFILKTPSSFHQKLLKPLLEDIHHQIKQTSPHNLSKSSVIIQTSPAPLKSLKRAPARLKPPAPGGYQAKSSVFSGWDFNSFVEGPGNSFALAGAKNIACQPGRSMNPLFIYGSTGLGKTHLLLAIGNFLEKRGKKALYLPAERFFNDCIHHIQKHSMASFREKYRKNISVLLLDDIQILGKGESIQEEFFHTYESLKQNACQIVLAGDKKPKDIKGLKDRLRTRFLGGVVADIQPPNFETKIAILRQKSLQIKTAFPEDIILYLSRLPMDSVRELEGALNKIRFLCEFQKTKVSLELVQKLFPMTSPKSSLLPEQIQQICADFFHLKLMDLKSRARSQKIIRARNLSMWLIREKSGLSLCQIGRIFGGKDHSSVLKALKKTKIKLQENQEIIADFKNLELFLQKAQPSQTKKRGF